MPGPATPRRLPGSVLGFLRADHRGGPDTDPMLRGTTLWLAISVALAAGCGSKTGLDVPDGEVDAGPEAGLDAGVPCVEIVPDGGPIELPLETQAEVGRADVLFLIDVTASMQDEIDGIRDQLRDRLAPAIEAEIRDTQLAVGTFGDFPIDPYGDADDTPFELLLPMTDDLTRVQAAVNAIELGNGRDEAESQVEALYQVATGAGLGSYVPPSFGCPSGGFGYPCFRDDALPIVLLFTDAPFHNGFAGRNRYSGSIAPAPHVYEDARDELVAAGIRVIGFDSGGGDAGQDLRQVASDTGALDGSGGPLVFNIGRRGESLGTGVVDAMKTFADAVVFDIDLLLVDPVPGDGVDVTGFVERIVPLRADPADGIESIDVGAGVFRGVTSGTTVTFQLVLRNDIVAPGPTARRFNLEVIFRGDGRTRLARRIVTIVVPGADGTGCDDPL